MSRRRTVMYALLLFVSGLILGASIMAAGVRFRLIRGLRGPRPPMPVVIMERLDRELDLSAAQRDSLRPIIEDAHGKFEALRQENRPRMEGIIDEAQNRAGPLLSEDQRGRLRVLRERARDHFERRGGRH